MARAYYARGGVGVEFFDCLLDTYGRNEAILSREIAFQGYSAPWIKKALKNLCDEGKVVRFERGVYYIPEDTPLGRGRLDVYKRQGADSIENDIHLTADREIIINHDESLARLFGRPDIENLNILSLNEILAMPFVNEGEELSLIHI